MLRWIALKRLRRQLRRLFSHVYVHGRSHLRPWCSSTAPTTLLLHSSHNGWSDIALAALLTWDYLRLQHSFFLLSPHQLKQLRLLRFLGARTIPWDDLQQVQQVLPDRVRPLLTTAGRVVWIFATGDFLSTGETDPFWYCMDMLQLAGRPIALAPAVWTYDLLQQEPRCYLWLGEPQLYDPQIAPSLFVRHCSHRLAELYSHQQYMVSNGFLHPHYECYSL